MIFAVILAYNEEKLIKNVIEKTSKYVDKIIIIDDGSHRPFDQIATFNILFPALTGKGIYVIEDIGGLVADELSITVSTLKVFIDKINYWPEGFPPPRWGELWRFPIQADYLSKNIVGIAFYRYIAFIFKGNNPGDNPYLTRSSDVFPQ